MHVHVMSCAAAQLATLSLYPECWGTNHVCLPTVSTQSWKAACQGQDTTCLYDDWDGKVDIVSVDEADSAASEASKGSMHGTLPQHLAVDAVIGSCGYSSDHVGRVNVLDVHTLRSHPQCCYSANLPGMWCVPERSCGDLINTP